MEPTTDTNLFELKIDPHSAGYLGETARWARFLSIVGFIICGLSVLGSFFIGALVTDSMAAVGASNPFSAAFSTISLLITTLILFFPTLYLFKFSSKMRNALRSNDQQLMEISLSNLKSFFKFWGIFTIIILSLYTLIIIFAIVGAMVMHH